MASFLSSSAGRGLADSFGKFLFFRCDTERLRNLDAGPRLDRTRLRHPRLRVRLGIFDCQCVLDRVAIDAMISLNSPHLVAVRLTLRAKPGLFVETDCFDDKGVTIPSADRISIPSWIRIIRKFAPVHPNFAKRV